MKRFFSIILGCFSLLFLTACEQSDIDIVLGFLQDWSVEKGITDEEGNPTTKAIKRGLAGDWYSTGDPEVDAAIDAGIVVKNVRNNDKLSNEAKNQLAKNPPDRNAALGNLDEAIKNRPDDWYYRTQRSVLRTEIGDPKGAENDYQASSQGCGNNQYCRKRLWETRIQLLKESEERQRRTDGMPRCDTFLELSDAYDVMSRQHAGDDAEKTRLMNISNSYNEIGRAHV